MNLLIGVQALQGSAGRQIPRPPASGSLPAWYTGAASGEWVALASSTFGSSGVGWAGTSPGGTGNYTQVVRAWCSGIVNTVGLDYGSGFVAGTWLVIWGGGHNDYGGNEIYAFGPLESASPAWRRVTDPTIPAPNNVARSGSNPVSRHTYDTIIYDRVRNRMVSLNAPSIYSNGFSNSASDAWDFAARTWSAGPSISTNGGGINSIEATCGGDDTYAWLWPIGNNQILTRYQFSSDTITQWTKDLPGDPTGVKAAYHPTKQVLARYDSGTLYALDLRNPATAVQYTVSTTGAAPGGNNVVLEYDAANDRFVAWANSGKTLYTLTLPANPYQGGSAWTWASTTSAGGATPATQTPNGTFGRFRYLNGDGVNTLRGALLMPTDSSPVYFYKP